MNEPNPYLLELYGTDKIAARAKAEGMPTAVRIAAALMGFGLMMHSESETDEAQERARILDEIGRRMEEARMQPLLNSLSKEGSVQGALLSGQYMAKLAAAEYFSEMEKEALNLTMPGSVGGAVKMVGRLVKKRKPKVPSFRGTGAPAGAPLTMSAPGALGTPVGAVGSLATHGTPAPAKSPGILRRAKKAPAVPSMRGTGEPGAPITMSAPGTLGAPAGPMPSLRETPKLKPGTTELATTAPTTGTALAKRPKTEPTAGTLRPSDADAGEGGGSLKGKLLAAGMLGAGGWGTIQAAQAAKDYMMIPSQQTQRWGYGPRAPASVNRYGYAAY